MNRLWTAVGLVAWLTSCEDSKPAPPDRDAGPREDAGREAGAGQDAEIDAGVDASRDAGDDAAVPVDPELETTTWRPMFDASLSEWYRFLPSLGRDMDPAGVFALQDGVLQILGIPPPPGEQEFGYLATRSDYGNYRFKLEQRWGTTKFAPRADVVRDSGLLFHVVGPDRVWPQCPEFQIQENDTGDLFLLGDVGATTLVDPEQRVFEEGGVPVTLRSAAVTKGGTFDSLTDWNTLELIATEREFMFVVNQRVNHRGWDLEYASGGIWRALTRGRIALQAEGAEVFYRNAQLRPVSYPPPPPGAVVLFDGTNLDAFRETDWRIVNGALEVVPGSGDLYTQAGFGDVRLHFEFRLPATLDAAVAELERPASVVFLQGSYGIVLADSFARPLSERTSAAVGTVAPRVHEALPAEVWQSVDLVFRSARWSSDGQTKQRNAYVTIVYNGSEVHRQLELADETPDGADESPSGGGAFRIADRGVAVRFRNIWLERL